MKEYDIIVIGSGCGQIVAFEAAEHAKKTALIDRGPTGGTCLNVGCVPSKILIACADRLMEIREAGKLGIKASVEEIDFGFIMDRMRKAVARDRDALHDELVHSKTIDYYYGETRFIGDHTLEFKDERLRAQTIVIASGSRPAIPSIAGLDRIHYLTNESLLKLQGRPESLLIVGGGYIAVEYAHFFAALGTKVTIVEIGPRLVPSEEPEISHLLFAELSKRVKIHLNTECVSVEGNRGGIKLLAIDRASKAEKSFQVRDLLIAAGRRSNADLLQAEKTGVKLDTRGYITVNDYLRTNKRNIFAVGDAIGNQMFTHVANNEAGVVAGNILHGSRIKMDFAAAPHAIFTHPQIASVGLTEEKARATHDILVGEADYFDVAGGEAIAETSGFAKAVVDKSNGMLLGFHIIGPQAPILIQEITDAMALRLNIDDIRRGLHIHPALSELILNTLAALK
jgi:mycothione reductase